MNKFLKVILLTFCLMVSTALVKPVSAFEMNAIEENISQIGQYVQKISKVALYVQTKKEHAEQIIAMGTEEINAAVGYLESVKSKITEVQGKLRFADPRTFAGLLGSKAKKQESSATAKEEVLPKEGAAAQVKTAQSAYGIPQENKEQAQKYVKNMLYYSTKEGDKYEGAVLTNTDMALKMVQKNRNAYYQEVMANAYGIAAENTTTVRDESAKRLQELQQKSSSAPTLDDKKAIEALIIQEEVRQRMYRLNLELAKLELDVLTDLQGSAHEYLIPRTVEQIKADTQKEMKNVDYSKDKVNKEGG